MQFRQNFGPSSVNVLREVYFNPGYPANVGVSELCWKVEQQITKGLFIRCIPGSVIAVFLTPLCEPGRHMVAQAEKAYGFTAEIEFQILFETLAKLHQASVRYA